MGCLIGFAPGGKRFAHSTDKDVSREERARMAETVRRLDQEKAGGPHRSATSSQLPSKRESVGHLCHTPRVLLIVVVRVRDDTLHIIRDALHNFLLDGRLDAVRDTRLDWS